jgi:hypothetical protein
MRQPLPTSKFLFFLCNFIIFSCFFAFSVSADDEVEWVLTDVILSMAPETHNDCYNQTKNITPDSAVFISENLPCAGKGKDPGDWHSSARWNIPPERLEPGKKIPVSGTISRISDDPELFQDDHLTIGFDGPGCYTWKTSCQPYYPDKITGEVKSSISCKTCTEASVSGTLPVPSEGPEIVLQYETNAGVASYVYTYQGGNVTAGPVRSGPETKPVNTTRIGNISQTHLFPSPADSGDITTKGIHVTQPGSDTSVSCECALYDIASEPIDCLFKGKGCSPCHAECLSRKKDPQNALPAGSCGKGTGDSLPPCTVPLNITRHYYGPVEPGSEISVLYPAGQYTLWYAAVSGPGLSSESCDPSWDWIILPDVEIAVNSSLAIHFTMENTSLSPDNLIWQYSNVSLGNKFGEIRFIVENKSDSLFSAILCPKTEDITCDCQGYDLSAESADCLITGEGCSPCHDTCNIPEEEQETLPQEADPGPGCHCQTYEFHEESLECMLEGKECSPCYYECTGRKEEPAPAPVKEVKNSSCDCKTYDSSNETLNCLVEYRGCSDCFLECMWGLPPE